MKKEFKKKSRYFHYTGYFLAITLILSFFTLGGTSFGFQPGYRCHHSGAMRMNNKFKRFKMMNMLDRELKLTRPQLLRLKKLRMINFKTMMKMRKSLKNPMFEALQQGTFNGQVFEAAALKNAKIMIKMREKSMNDFLSVLTPRQKKEFFILLKIKRGDWSWYKG